MEHAKDKRNALPNRHEADHDGKHRGQKADNLGQNALEHGASHDAAQLSSGTGFLQSNLPSYKIESSWPYGLVAGDGFEPPSSDAESDVLPLHQPAAFKRTCGRTYMRRSIIEPQQRI